MPSNPPEASRTSPLRGASASPDSAPPTAEALAARRPEEVTRYVQAHLEAARRALDDTLEAPGARTVETTLAGYDRLLLHLDAAAHLPGLLERVHPDAGVREASEAATQEVDRFATEVSLHRGLYDALRQIDATAADPATRHYLERTLRDYRRAGVDRDEATRDRIRALQEELTLIGQEFARNIQSDTRSIQVPASALQGLPEDWVRAHPADAGGQVTVTTDYPDYVPFMSYSHDDAARRRLYVAFRQRGHPQNATVLQRMLERRWELARLLGYPSWAAYVTEDKMIGSADRAREFLERISRIADARARADYDRLLQQKRRSDPEAQEVNDWEKEFLAEQVRSAAFDFDSQSVRPYFPYARVKQGILDLAAELFGVTFRKVENAAVWHPSVETYDVYEAGQPAGRFHLDMHPRPDKYKHAAQFTLRTGVAGKQLPEAALVCNFPGGTEGEPGLLEHDDVSTFLHEFGHLLHTLFAWRLPWIGISGISTEWDFVEAPSQMLEEWALDTTVLQRFAHHVETGEPIPADLVARLRRAEEFGKGAAVRQQMFYAMLSLSLYDRDPAGLDVEALVREMQERYGMYRFVEGTHFQSSFGHLDGYSAIYYTYMWSLVIAKDLFSRFDRSDLMNRDIARAYRDRVLAAGGSAPADQLVRDFLGREWSFEAYESWLNAD